MYSWETQLYQHDYRNPEGCSDRSNHKIECHGALRVAIVELQGPGGLRGGGVHHRRQGNHLSNLPYGYGGAIFFPACQPTIYKKQETSHIRF